jgi:hypothetical protein
MNKQKNPRIIIRVALETVTKILDRIEKELQKEIEAYESNDRNNP